ncbi:MAG: hypothetical protein K9N06_12910 [Candidatus Cloacimonetes bacterium]|nr:hypothetical protein [Candidatus Cloacimonadota bacterium]
MKKRSILLVIMLAGVLLLSAASISGIITAEGGEIFSCSLFLYHGQNLMNPAMIEDVVTGEPYTLTDIEPGIYRLRVIPFSYQYPPQFYPGVSTPEEAELLILNNPGVELTGIDFYLEDGGAMEMCSLSGILVDENANGVAGQEIYLYGILNNFWNTYLTETEEDGSFEIAGIFPGEYILFVEYLPGYQHYFWENAHNFQGADVLFFEPGEVLTDIMLILEPATYFNISGTVRELDGEEIFPLSGALVSGYAIACGGEGEYFQEITDEYGHYATDTAAGRYYLFSTCGGYSTQYWENVSTHVEATPLHINQDVENVDFLLTALEDPGDNSISGYITLDGEEPGFQSVVIVIASDEDDDWSETTVSESSGYYFIDEIPAGDYYVVMMTSSTPPVYYPEGYDWENAITVYIEGNVTNINFAIEYPAFNGVFLVEGLVEKPDRTPVSGAAVVFFDEDNFPVSFGISDADGHYEAVSLSTGMYSVLATKTFFDSEMVEMSLNESDEYDFVINPITTDSDDAAIPTVFSEMQCYPNPFIPGSRSSARISLTPSVAGAVRISVFNLRGQLVENLYTGWLAAQPAVFNWDGANVGSGIFIIALERNGIITETEKVLLLK